jgi:hypothetical protein
MGLDCQGAQRGSVDLSRARAIRRKASIQSPLASSSGRYKSLFGTYKQACEKADALLYSLYVASVIQLYGVFGQAPLVDPIAVLAERSRKA